MITFFDMETYLLNPKKALGSVYYAGRNYENYNKIHLFQVKSLGEKIEETFHKYKDYLIDLDQKLNIDACILWHASDIAENNQYLQDFPSNCMKSIILLDQAKISKELCIVFDSYAEINLFKKMFIDNGYQCRVFAKRVFPFKEILKSIYIRLHSIYHEFEKIFALKEIRKNLGVKPAFDVLLKSDIVFLSWAFRNSFEKERFWKNDRYFGFLPTWIKEDNKNICFIGKPVNFVDEIEKIYFDNLCDDKSVLFVYDFITYFDIIKVHIKSILFFKYFFKKFFVDEYCLTQIYRDGIKKDLIKPRIAEALLSDILILKLKNMNLKNKFFIYPFENQPWEKVSLFSQKNNLGKSKWIAYQFFVFPKNYLPGFFSAQTLSKGLFPGTLVTSDKESDHHFKKQKENQVVLGGNFRYANSRMSQVQENNFTARVGICACSIQLNDSLELINKAVEVAKELAVELWVNFHPMMSDASRQVLIKRINNFKGQGIENITLRPIPMSELLPNASFVLYNSSSICFEAAFEKVPCIFVQSDIDIDLNRFPYRDILKFREPQQGKKIIADLINNEIFFKNYAKEIYKVAMSWYTPPNRDLFMQSLEPSTRGELH